MVMLVFGGETDTTEYLQRALTGLSSIAAGDRFRDLVVSCRCGASRKTPVSNTDSIAMQSVVAHARRWRTAWNLPIGWPNCSRSDSRARLPVPTAVSAAPSISAVSASRPRKRLRAAADGPVFEVERPRPSTSRSRLREACVAQAV